ncbi:hypothetical protein B296_00006375 [Ensete ventricosum]|uniref:Uncharacterized protein n=1 Tax=Ensete ventricosum TaxID=4639 RepID=A0A426XVC2_ENSVE|nr:hypothetical protein B296_00006375 [Ensete ventricosum]
MNGNPLIIKKDAPPWPSGTIALTTTMSSTPNCGQMFIIGADTSRVGVNTILMQDGQQHEEVKMGPENHHSHPPQTRIRLTPPKILSEGNPHSKRRHDYYYKATTWQPMQGRNFPLTNTEAKESSLRKIKFSFISSSTSTKFKPQESGLLISLGLTKLGITFGL